MTTDELMSQETSLVPTIDRPARHWRRAGASLLALTVIALWIAALPALLARSGLVTQADGCMLRGYRDPVTGRAAPSPKQHDAVGSNACRVASLGGRP